MQQYAAYVEANPIILYIPYKVLKQECTIACTVISYNDSKTGRLKTTIVYCDLEFMRGLMKPEIFTDATFGARVKLTGCTQLLTVMVYENGKTFPVLWASMPGKKTEDYRVVWNHVKSEFPNFQPSVAHCDFEMSFYKSLKEFCPSIKIKGCNFHLGQAMLRTAIKIKFFTKRNIKEEETAKYKLVKKPINLALLPLDEIKYCWVSLKREFKNELGTGTKVTKFLKYVDKQCFRT